ncbi:hypothetical protein DFS33DRAFT_1387242 [Desarmillaria ectypa]|nr:hypothetical protein DFS33DRAFT_1387242 [Desarmillaria ectypa]
MGTEHFQSQIQSTEHRLAILSKWDIPKGSKDLELGCGQGDCSAVLVELVGPNGHVTAVDPGSLDYGSPHTLGQAQDNLSSSVLADPIEFLKNDDGQYDVAVPTLAKNKVCKVCIAKWSLSSARVQCHILAALAQVAMQYHNPSLSNIRTLFSLVILEASAIEAGLKLERPPTLIPANNVLDVLSEDDRQKALVTPMRDAVRASYEQAGGRKQICSMDVWCGTFAKA